MLLAVDIGNTNIVMGGIRDGAVLFEERMETQAAAAPDAFALKLKRVLAREGVAAEEFDGAIISSVVPPVFDAVRSGVRVVTGREPLVVSAGMKTGLELRIDHPEKVGSDRIVIAVAALAKHAPPLILIDMGTATTIEAVGEGNTYLGGCIIPGVKVALDALSARAAQLPVIELGQPGSVIATNTADSMRSGALYGAAAMLDGMIERMEETLGREATVVATGGVAPLVVPLCRRAILLDQDLLLKGLDILYQMNR